MATRSKARGQRSRAARVRKGALALLENDHRKVRELLAELEQTTSKAVRRRGELLARIALEVEVHAAIEEELFYPAFREKGETSADEKLYLAAQEEHGLVHGLLPQLQETDMATELFSARAKLLKDLVEHHADEEESELFPRVREVMSDEELAELGTRLEQRKLELTDQGGPGTSADDPAGRGDDSEDEEPEDDEPIDRID